MMLPQADDLHLKGRNAQFGLQLPDDASYFQLKINQSEGAEN